MFSSRRYAGGLQNSAVAAVVALCCASIVQAHEHHTDRIPEGQYISPDPIDSILWTHILVQITAWGIVFPTGMVLGIIRSRWHVPTQTLGTALAVVGYFLGHKHHGRQFAENVHSTFAPYLNLLLFIQIVLGVYLRLHIERGFLGKIRKVLVVGHGVVGKIIPVAGWTQMLFGGITALGFCREDHLGQCAAHFIMGSAFIAYGIILTILLLVGQAWLRRTGRSQEFFDSIVIAAWGCVNTFTEHRWGGPWVRNDLQHTSMGIVWWAAGLLGIWLSRKRDGRPKRNIIPAIVLILTGYGMSAHPQELPLSTMIHTFFGYSLMLAGLSRIIEISFILRDRSAVSADGSDASSWQHLTPFLLCASGFMFMGATEEQMALLSEANVTHVSYILILYSFAFLLYLFVNILLHIYAVHAFPPIEPRHRHGAASHESRHSGKIPETAADVDAEAQQTNGRVRGVPPTGGIGLGLALGQRQRVRDAQEFELDALISEEEDEDGHVRHKPEPKETRGQGKLRL